MREPAAEPGIDKVEARAPGRPKRFSWAVWRCLELSKIKGVLENENERI